MKSFTRILPLLLLLGGPLAMAGSVQQEQNRLDRYQQSLENRISELEAIENSLFGFDQKLIGARQEVGRATTDLDAARKTHTAAAIKLAGADSDDNKRAEKLSAHALKMSERGVRSRTKRLGRLENGMQELQVSQAEIQAKLIADKARITAQEGRLEKADLDAKRKTRLLAKADAAKLSAQAEQNLNASAAAAAERLAAEQHAKQAADAAKRAIAEAQASPADTELSDLDREALEYAQKEVLQLEELLASGKPGRPIFSRLVLNGNMINGYEFEFLGKNQYRAQAVVSKGKQIFEIGRHKYRRTIPSSDDGQEYVFIFDAKRPSRPRLVMYKKSLLSAN